MWESMVRGDLRRPWRTDRDRHL
ncbi:hypothetical protein Taro_051653 [Colocasia esculenta]|uniref:Uncharacterized protein n=1 Tax=Colocasia esculenta TaxID=4460 RepID=A0A843XGN0_COLES|nr:hypothetical protein [Colocasia esculenta]